MAEQDMRPSLLETASHSSSTTLEIEADDVHVDHTAGEEAFGPRDDPSDSAGSSSLFSLVRGLFVRDAHSSTSDPVRRKQAGWMRVRYHSLLNEAADEEEAEAEPETNVERGRVAVERQQLAELTGSFFESTWVFLLILGFLASLTAWTIDAAVLGVVNMRDWFTSLAGKAWLPEYLLFTLFRVFILLLGVACTKFICPDAAGSGIPEMRSILSGFPAPKYLSKRALVAKSVGLVFALGSGLSVGKEGPFVHLSSIIAHQLVRAPLFQQIRRSKDLTHHLLLAACAVGVTATFGTPIGGVLFSIEVTTTYYVTSNYWRSFFVSVVTVVVFRMLNNLVSEESASLFTTDFVALPYHSYEIVLFLILAAICGLLGALFVRTYRVIMELKRVVLEDHIFVRWPAARGYGPFVYASLVALVFSLVEYPVGSFMQLTQREIIDDMFSSGNLTASDATNLSELYGKAWTSPSLAINLFAYSVLRFLSTAISATVMVPSGIVTPVFAVGTTIGRLFGELVVLFGAGNELAGGYAVVGAASFTAGVTGTVSIAVIVFELTNQLSYMVPVLLCVLVGRSVALYFSLDMYETISRQKNLPQWPDLMKQSSYGLVAGDLMRGVPSYWILRRHTLSSLRKVVAEAPKEVRSFPIVDDEQTLFFLGVVKREELESILEMWTLCLEEKNAPEQQIDSQPASLAGFASNNPAASSSSRKIAMSNRFTLAGLTTRQATAFTHPDSHSTAPVDLLSLDLLNVDSENFHVQRDEFASHVILLISVHKCPELFVTARGRLLGVIHASDLLARSRRYTL